MSIITQKKSLEYKGFSGTVFYSKLYDNYFGWVQNVEGLLYYEYENIDMLRFHFKKSVDEYLKFKEYIPHGYTNTKYLFEQLTRDKSYEELSNKEKEIFDQSIHKFWDWNSVIKYAREEAQKAGEDYRYLRSIAEIHDSAFEVGCFTTSSHIAERLLAKGVDYDIVKEVCELPEQH